MTTPGPLRAPGGWRDLADLLARVETCAPRGDRNIDAALVGIFGGISKSGIPVCAGVLGIGGFTSSIDRADSLLADQGLIWCVSLEGHVYVTSRELGHGHRPKGNSLPLKLVAGAIMHEMEEAAAAAPREERG